MLGGRCLLPYLLGARDDEDLSPFHSPASATDLAHFRILNMCCCMLDLVTSLNEKIWP